MDQVIEKTLAEYIERTLKELAAAKQTANPQDIQWNQYEVYPEDNGYDLPKNPYSPV